MRFLFNIWQWRLNWNKSLKTLLMIRVSAEDYVVWNWYFSYIPTISSTSRTWSPSYQLWIHCNYIFICTTHHLSQRELQAVTVCGDQETACSNEELCRTCMEIGSIPARPTGDVTCQDLRIWFFSISFPFQDVCAYRIGGNRLSDLVFCRSTFIIISSHLLNLQMKNHFFLKCRNLIFAIILNVFVANWLSCPLLTANKIWYFNYLSRIFDLIYWDVCFFSK